jgi:N-acetylmuramoyl-L-alanine amidase
MRPLKKIVVHCSATPPSMDVGVAEIAAWHTAPKPLGNGWKDIGYHYVIRRDGTLETGRDVKRQGAHVSGHNVDSIGICLVGGQATADFDPAQYATLRKLVRSLLTTYGPLRLVGHHDLDRAKPCPRFDVYKWWLTSDESAGQQ